MKREIISGKKFSENPFKVPDNYFENFATQLMAKLPEQATPAEEPKAPAEPVRISFYTRIKPYLYLAAMFCGLFFGIQVYKYQIDQHNATARAITEQTASNTSSVSTGSDGDYVDEVCNFTNPDKDVLYSCLTDEDN